MRILQISGYDLLNDVRRRDRVELLQVRVVVFIITIIFIMVNFVFYKIMYGPFIIIIIIIIIIVIIIKYFIQVRSTQSQR